MRAPLWPPHLCAVAKLLRDDLRRAHGAAGRGYARQAGYGPGDRNGSGGLGALHRQLPHMQAVVLMLY